MVSTTKNNRTEKLGITLPKSLLRTIDNKRGDIPRSTYIRRAIENYLKSGGRRIAQMNCSVKRINETSYIVDRQEQGRIIPQMNNSVIRISDTSYNVSSQSGSWKLGRYIDMKTLSNSKLEVLKRGLKINETKIGNITTALQYILRKVDDIRCLIFLA